MATGIEMMMKSFGIDPEKIKQEFKTTFEDVTAKVMSEVRELKATQERIEMKLDEVLKMRGQFDSMNAIESDQTSVTHINAGGDDWQKESGAIDGGYDNRTSNDLAVRN